MSKYDLFRDRTKIETGIAENNVANFIEKSLSSTTVNHIRLDEEIPVVLTRSHKEGNDEIILFSYPNHDDPTLSLKVGDYILHKTKHYLVFMEHDHPLQDKYLKYNVLECNVIIKFDNFSQYGAYFSNMRSFAGQNSKVYADLLAKFENVKPVIITANSPELTINKRFLAANEGFRINSIDRISNNGIAYLSIEQASYNPSTDIKTESKAVTPPAPQVVVPITALKKGEEKVILTNQGFVSFDPYIQIIKRTMTTVTFKVPFDISSLRVTTKDNVGDLVINTYEVI